MLSTLFNGSIRKTLLALFMISALPGIVFILVTGQRNRAESIAHAQKDLLQFSRHLAEIQVQRTQDTQRLLEELAQLPEVRKGDAEACSRLFANLLRLNPLYAVLHLVDPKGDMVASGTTREPVNFAATRHFREALATRCFATGEFILGVTLRAPVFTFGAPVLDEQGNVLGVLLTSIRLANYGDLFNTASFPPNSFVGIYDHNGARLYRHPERLELPLGDPINPPVFQALAAGPPSDIVRQPASTGIEFLIAYQQVRLAPDSKPYLYILTGAPENVVHAVAQNSMRRDLLVLLSSLGLALGGGWFLGGRTLGKRLEDLARAAKRFGAGDLEARAAQATGNTELDALTNAFNQMAQSLSLDIAQRERVEEQLRQSRAILEAALASMADAVFISDVHGELIDFNEAFATFHKFKNKNDCYRSVIDYPQILDVHHENGEALPEDQWAVPRALRGETVTNAVYHVRRKDTGECWIGSYSFGPIRDKHGAIAGSVVVGRDITAVRQAQQAVLASLREKEALLKEIHHRVKNNLQIICSLLHLQGERVNNPDALDILNDSQARVLSMAAVHDQLYRSRDLAAIDIGGYLESLLPTVRRAYGEEHAVEILTDVSQIPLSIEQAVPFGLVLNELLTNAFKHAFKDRERGTIRIEARMTDDSVVLRFEDDGPGLPPGFTLDSPSTLGMHLISALTGQLRGSVSVEPGSGAHFRIAFPLHRR